MQDQPGNTTSSNKRIRLRNVARAALQSEVFMTAQGGWGPI